MRATLANYSAITKQKITLHFAHNSLKAFLTNLFVKFMNTQKWRSVAQPGSALDWGSRGRGFKSRRSDHLLKHGMTTC